MPVESGFIMQRMCELNRLRSLTFLVVFTFIVLLVYDAMQTLILCINIVSSMCGFAHGQ